MSSINTYTLQMVDDGNSPKINERKNNIVKNKIIFTVCPPSDPCYKKKISFFLWPYLIVAFKVVIFNNIKRYSIHGLIY